MTVMETLQPARDLPTLPAITVGDHMSRALHTVDADQTLEAARELMERCSVRHLPVMARGRLVGLISLQDLDMVELLREVDPRVARVGGVMNQRPYLTTVDARLKDVTREMAAERQACAIVLDGRRIAGIITTTDALQLLADLL